MINFSKNHGFVMLEALLATGLVIIFLGGLGTLFTLNINGSARVHQFEQAQAVAESGLQALRTLAFDDLTVKDPAHLVFSSPNWTIVDGSETIGDFTRTVSISEVQRDGDCNVVASGGTVDPDSKMVSSEVTWSDLAGREHTTTLSGLMTRWNDPQGDCFMPAAANNLIFHIETTLWYGGKQLRELYLENGGSDPFTISHMTFTWDNSANIQQIFMDSNKLWSSSGPGTPSGLQPSGTRLDITDATINPGEIFDMNKTQFDSAMSATTLTLTIEFTDGSIFVSDPFIPSYSGSGTGTLTCFTSSDLNFYIPFKTSTSGDYPTMGTTPDSVTVRTSSPTSSGYLNIGASFSGISSDILDPIIYLTFSDLDLHTITFTSGTRKATGAEAFILKDGAGLTLASLGTSHPDTGSFTWSQALSTDLFSSSPVSFTLRFSTLIQLIKGTYYTLSNSAEAVTGIQICGTVP
ncbi:MAG: type II secretion system protein [Patescibacteria group bacterium]|jgi:type II secretory pathway pseudopilin PulG